MNKLLITFLTLILSNCILSTIAQTNPNFILRVNIGIGADYNMLEYDNYNGSGEVAYSPGGGMGIEIGAESVDERDRPVEDIMIISAKIIE